MTIYYIDPGSGNDSNTGLSWAQAWKTLRGLRVAAVVPVAGDEIRFAQSLTFYPSMGDYERSGWDYVNWYLRGESVLYSWNAVGRNAFQSWWPPGTDVLQLQCYQWLMVSGAMTIDVPTWAGDSGSNYDTIHAVSNDGGYLAPSQMLFGGGMSSLSAASANGMNKFQGAVRCHIPYTGTGDIDLPAGSIELTVYDGTTPLFSAPLPAIRNSADEWTAFEIDFTAWPNAAISNLQVRFSRSSVPITRDSSPFGLEFTTFYITRPTGVRVTDSLLSLTRSNFSGSASPEIAGTNDMGVYLERLNGGNEYSADEYYNARVGSEVYEYVSCYRVPDVSMTGRLPLSPTGATGVYDLNGSTGGTTGSPLKITGGWNKSTDAQEGITAFSAGYLQQYGSSFAWIDLYGATNIQFENIAVAYGFGSFVSRPGTVSFKRCMLPFSIKPTFGVTDINANITLENMYVAPLVMEGFGVIGDFSLKNTYCVTQQNPKATRRNEVNNFYMNNSHFGIGDPFYGDRRPIYVRGDGLLEQCSLVQPVQLVSISFGHSLIFKNHKAHPATWTVRPIPTAPESRWDLIDYQDASMPTYNFGTPPATGATCDAKVMIASSIFVSGTQYPTGLRGNRVTNLFMDGMNDFMSSSFLGGADATERGHMYSHYMAQRPTYQNLETPSSLVSAGDIATPPWSKELEQSSGVISVVETPQLTATARIFVAKKFTNVLYRTNDEFYLVAGRNVNATTRSVGWVALKFIYLPRAGLYRAHFGCMKENLSMQTYAGNNDAYRVPLTMYKSEGYVSDTGAQLGNFGVFSNSMVGSSKIVKYYASTPEEVAAGSGGNENLDQWKDYYVDFEMFAAGLVELRHGSDDNGYVNQIIFDILNIYERT